MILRLELIESLQIKRGVFDRDKFYRVLYDKLDFGLIDFLIVNYYFFLNAFVVLRCVHFLNRKFFP
jgi:hypothetical protein